MIKIKDKQKLDLEDAIYEAAVEEALAKWEAAKPIKDISLEKDDKE